MELIVVIVILAILAAIAIPALTGYIEKAKHEGYKQEARNVIMAAQTLISESWGNATEDSVDTGRFNHYSPSGQLWYRADMRSPQPGSTADFQCYWLDDDYTTAAFKDEIKKLLGSEYSGSFYIWVSENGAINAWQYWTTPSAPDIIIAYNQDIDIQDYVKPGVGLQVWQRDEDAPYSYAVVG